MNNIHGALGAYGVAGYPVLVFTALLLSCLHFFVASFAEKAREKSLQQSLPAAEGRVVRRKG
jgi:hypothetical protein